MRARACLFALALTAMTSPLHGQAGSADLNATFRRGVGVHRPLNWADLSDADPSRYAWPPFASAEHQVSDALIAGIRAAGFDFVRLTVDPGPFLQMTGDRRDRLDDILSATIGRFRSRGLSVIVNFHSNSQVSMYRPEVIFTGAETPLFQSYVAMIARTAGRLEAMGDPGIALEPVNEPPAGYDAASAARWQAMMKALYQAARARAPHLLIVVTGAQGGSRRGLALLDPRPFQGADTLYSFHYYEPHLLTHQGVDSHEPNERFWRDLRGLPYPARSEAEDVALEETRHRIETDPEIPDRDKPGVIADARKAISQYVKAGWKARVIDGAFDEVASWAFRFNVDPRRILLGEFGATRAESKSDEQRSQARAQWLHDVRCAAERHRFRWSIWELNGTGGMAVIDFDHPNRIDPLTRKSLGLQTSQAAAACP